MATGNKIISSVYAGIQIQSNGLGNREVVSYSKQTYISVRSGKHSSSTAFNHGLDFKKLLALKEFDVITKSGINSLVKSIFMLIVDSSPGENPVYQKVINVAIYYFLRYQCLRKKCF